MKDLEVVNGGSVQSLTVAQVGDQIRQIQSLMAVHMKEGEHYGKSYPGDTKKNLLKPGADKLMFMFRLRTDFEQEIKELTNGHREIITHCRVYNMESGNKVAEGVGSASTMESKYRWRNAKRKCPKCGAETLKPGKKELGYGWACIIKDSGCGTKFEENDPEIINQKVGRVENPDIADVYNTVLKISKKRAYVDAAITATAASDIFSQDADDLEPEPEEKKLNGKDLAKEAEKPEEKLLIERELILKSSAEILNWLNPDHLPYFTVFEKEQEHRIAKEAADIKTLQNQFERLKEELEKRKTEFKPIPLE